MSGPSVRIVVKCHGCDHHKFIPLDEHEYGEGAVESRCDEPSIGGKTVYHDTPDWCPLLEAAVVKEASKYAS